MKKYVLFILFSCSSFFANAQTSVYDGIPEDSSVYSFELGDPISRPNLRETIDTTGARVWRIGTTSKPFFSSGGVSIAIMTDTLNPYPPNTDDSFVIHLNGYYMNLIVSFWHKYETDSGKDGGIVEFSYGNSNVWHNVVGDCSGIGQGILTSNFYSKTDTIYTGEPAFSGKSNGWIYSRFQIFVGLPVKVTGSTAGCIRQDSVNVRFRFVSDTTADSLDGWMIDSIKVEKDKYTGSVNKLAIQGEKLNVYPNPAYDRINFPALNQPDGFIIQLYNQFGAKVMETPYRQTVDISKLPQGLYYYKVFNENAQYAGPFLIE